MDMLDPSWENMKLASIYSVVQNFAKTYFEPEGAAAIRMHCLGTKAVLMVPVDRLAAEMGSENQGGGGGKFKAYEEFFKKCSKTNLERMKDHLYTATVGPFDALYVPCGWCVSECVCCLF